MQPGMQPARRADYKSHHARGRAVPHTQLPASCWLQRDISSSTWVEWGRGVDAALDEETALVVSLDLCSSKPQLLLSQLEAHCVCSLLRCRELQASTMDAFPCVCIYIHIYTHTVLCACVAMCIDIIDISV